MIEIKNLPPYHERYVLAKHIDGHYWYWGSWSSEEEAYKVARNINGYVFDRECEERANDEEDERITFMDEMVQDVMDSLDNLRLEIKEGRRA